MPTYLTADEIEKKEKTNGEHASHDEHHHFQREHRTPGQMELGVTNIISNRQDMPRQVVASSGLANSQFRHAWEAHHKNDYAAALVAESFGVWFYVIAGEAATATLTFTTVAGNPQGNLLMIGFAYAFGIMFAINVCAPTSGGHFHPAMTIAQVIFKGFPASKAIPYILAQIFGAFIASLMVYASWKSEFTAYTNELIAAGNRAEIFTPTGPAGILAIFPTPGKSLGEIFANEFFGDLLIAMVIWSQLDAQNIFTSPSSAPYTIGLAFGVVVWGWSQATVVTNTARDLGARFACGAIWGRDCFPPAFSALAALTNVASSLVAITIYTFVLSDSRRPPVAIALAGHHEEEKARHDLSTQRHQNMLDEKISRTISRGGDPSALITKRSRLAPTKTKSLESSED